MRRAHVQWQVAASAVFLLLLIVLPAYYVVHKPFSDVTVLPAAIITGDLASIGMALLNLLADLILLVLTVAVAAAWGSRIIRWLGISLESGLERWTLGATLGLGLLGTLVFAVGVSGGLYRGVGYLLLVALALMVLPEMRGLARWIWAVPQNLRPAGIPWLWLFTGMAGLIALGGALLPPTGWDALVYHLQGPRLYTEAHRLLGVPENFYLNWPAQVEMLFTWGMLLKGDILAKLFHWAFWPLIAAMLYGLGRRSARSDVGTWAVVLWAAVPMTIELAGVAYVDLGLTAFVLAAFCAFMLWTESQSDSWLVLAALFVGFAISAKYTAITWLGLFILLFVYHAWRRRRQRAGWLLVRVAAFVVMAGLVMVPWLIKNWLVAGNPVYPFLFGGVNWNATREAWLYWPGQGYSQNLLDYLALPWIMTVVGKAGTAAFNATIGPLLLGLVPLAFLFRVRSRAVNYALALAAAQNVVFAVTIWRYLYLAQTRLLITIFPFLCLAAAYALDGLPLWDVRTFRLSWIVRVVVTLVLLLALLTEAHAFLALRPLAQLAGLESREGYLTRRLGYHVEAMRFTEDALPAGSQTMYLWEPRGYYGQSQALTDATLDNLSQLRVRYGDAGQALASLRADGFSHFLLYRTGLSFLLSPTARAPTLGSLLGTPPSSQRLYPLADSDLSFLESLIAQCKIIADVGGVYEVYQLP